MNKKEESMLEATSNIWNTFLSMPQYHPCEAQELCFHIHAIQRIIMSRECMRNNPILFPSINGVCQAELAKPVIIQKEPIQIFEERPRPKVNDTHDTLKKI